MSDAGSMPKSRMISVSWPVEIRVFGEGGALKTHGRLDSYGVLVY